VKINWHQLIAIGAIVLGLALLVIWFTTSVTSRTCTPRDDDPDGYLFRICLYVQKNQIDVSPGNPTSYHIKRVEERIENDRPVLWVFLDCCYLGDIAVIDKESGEVIRFEVGAQ
jgi:hypothetical protein